MCIRLMTATRRTHRVDALLFLFRVLLHEVVAPSLIAYARLVVQPQNAAMLMLLRCLCSVPTSATMPPTSSRSCRSSSAFRRWLGPGGRPWTGGATAS
jgi:hypothetical protein